MFTSVGKPHRETVKLCFEGRDLTVRKGLSVAAALLGAGITHFRNTPVTSAERGPFCMMGVCFDCLLVIDGEANQQSCMVEVRDGMRIERQYGAVEFGSVEHPAANAGRKEEAR